MLTIKKMRFASFLILLSVAAFISCSGDRTQVPANVVNIPNSASGNDDQTQLPVIEFTTTEHDFGKVIQGEIVTFSFKFKNTGKSDLVIANISAACGCTASKYPKYPVKPGQEDAIEVSFNSGGKQGFQNKTLTVAANTQPTNIVLTIKAQVFLPERQ
jgi:hypothetical protein